MTIYASKINHYMTAFQIKKEVKYQNQNFLKFIEEQNKKFFAEKNVILVGGTQGEWIELQLPDNEEEHQERMDRARTILKTEASNSIYNKDAIYNPPIGEEEQNVSGKFRSGSAQEKE